MTVPVGRPAAGRGKLLELALQVVGVVGKRLELGPGKGGSVDAARRGLG